MCLKDQEIIALFFERSEQAITELILKYGAAIKKVASNILCNAQDVEECSNDTYLHVWNRIPPTRPDHLGAYTCRIARNLCLKRYASNTAEKRNTYYDVALQELEGTIPALSTVESEYDAKELTSAINRVVEDINHRFTIEVLTRDFKSGDISRSAKNLIRDKDRPSDILYQIDSDALNDRLRELLEIKNKSEQSVTIRDAHRTEIREYLDMLDLTVELDIVTMTDLNLKKSRTAFSQPGMRYAQAEALVKTLMRDDVFRMLSLAERNRVTERILTDIRGRMMEDIVLLETKLAKPKCEVFQLTFASGEFDMVVFDPDAASCSIYEIKHSTEKHPKQIQHLIDERKCAETEHRFGTITGKYVIYRGENDVANDIQYLNVEEYLKKLR